MIVLSAGVSSSMGEKPDLVAAIWAPAGPLDSSRKT